MVSSGNYRNPDFVKRLVLDHDNRVSHEARTVKAKKATAVNFAASRVGSNRALMNNAPIHAQPNRAVTRLQHSHSKLRAVIP